MADFKVLGQDQGRHVVDINGKRHHLTDDELAELKGEKPAVVIEEAVQPVKATKKQKAAPATEAPAATEETPIEVQKEPRAEEA